MLRSRFEPVVWATRWRFCTVQVDSAQLKLRINVAAFGRPLIPHNCIRYTLNNTFSTRIQQPDSVLGFYVALGSCVLPCIQRFKVLLPIISDDSGLKMICLLTARYLVLCRDGGWRCLDLS